MTLDVTSHCLCVDDGIYCVFVSHNLGSLSEMRDLKSQIPTLCAHIQDIQGGLCVNAHDADFNCGEL